MAVLENGSIGSGMTGFTTSFCSISYLHRSASSIRSDRRSLSKSAANDYCLIRVKNAVWNAVALSAFCAEIVRF